MPEAWSDSVTALGQNWKHLSLPKQFISSKQLPRKPLLWAINASRKRGQGRTHATTAEYFVLRIEYFVMDSCDHVSLNQEKQ